MVLFVLDLPTQVCFRLIQPIAVRETGNKVFEKSSVKVIKP